MGNTDPDTDLEHVSDKEYFELCRELIRHEDGLVNNRVTWLLVLQGFLFAAFASGIGLYDKVDRYPRSPIFLTIGLLIVAGLGATTATVARNVVRTALDQGGTIKTWWEKDKARAERFPPVKGEFSGYFSIRKLPSFFAAAWVVLVLLLLSAVLFLACSPRSL